MESILRGETLSKDVGPETQWAYSRSLNLIDTSNGAFVSVESDGGRVRHVDGSSVVLEFAPAPAESISVTQQNLEWLGLFSSRSTPTK